MKVINWIRSMLKGDHASGVADDFALAKTLGATADTFLLPLGVAGLDAKTWAAKEAHFMAGYLQGYGDVVAQACGREPDSQLGANVALQFALRLMHAADASQAETNSFAEFLMTADGPGFHSGMAYGSKDANAFVTKKSMIATALGEHLGIR